MMLFKRGDSKYPHRDAPTEILDDLRNFSLRFFPADNSSSSNNPDLDYRQSKQSVEAVNFLTQNSRVLDQVGNQIVDERLDSTYLAILGTVAQLPFSDLKVAALKDALRDDLPIHRLINAILHQAVTHRAEGIVIERSCPPERSTLRVFFLKGLDGGQVDRTEAMVIPSSLYERIELDLRVLLEVGYVNYSLQPVSDTEVGYRAALDSLTHRWTLDEKAGRLTGLAIELPNMRKAETLRLLEERLGPPSDPNTPIPPNVPKDTTEAGIFNAMLQRRAT